VDVAPAASAAARGADICVTCTTSTEFLLGAEDVAPGTFVAGVGVDSERKRELAPALLAQSTVVVDVLSQCAAFGDLHHAIDAGLMSTNDVRAELGQIIVGARPGRQSSGDVIVFDSTGMALQDVAAAAVVHERALELDLGTHSTFRLTRSPDRYRSQARPAGPPPSPLDIVSALGTAAERFS
jgi:ornithine cyclodeaminase/alanine dehydrogenase-like protein (mu-crystallin family)